MERTPCYDKTNVKKGSWSSEEDAKLKDYIEKYGTGGNWIALPQKIGLKRCGKSCRLRWLNYLRPNIKHGGFSEEEDSIICSLYISIGSRWSIIAAQLPGRTDNDIKNYWNTRLKKKLEAKGIETLRNSANEIKLQLHMQHQSLENPNPPHYDNAPMWSCKLNHFQENMMQNFSPSIPQKVEYYHEEAPRMELQQCWAFQGEINEHLLGKGAIPLEGPHMSTEFDCFKDIDGAKDGMTPWWSSEFEANSTSSNSWCSK